MTDTSSGTSFSLRKNPIEVNEVVISGACTIEEFCFLGVNATIRDETVVARETLVGAGALILADTKEFEIYKAAGTVAAKVKSTQLYSISHKSGG
jgi:carbonic anhydrase/acetyltransferase-like protein (isoleucine patch superfamily)